MMKNLRRTTIILGISLFLALFGSAITYFAPPVMQLDFPAAMIFQQPTSTPPAEDVSEIGSTDGIIAVGGVIVLIVIVPIFLYRKAWMRTSSP